MLNINPETVSRLVDMARTFHAQEQVSFPDEPDLSSDDWGVQILAEHAGDMTLDEFRATVNDLEPDQQWELVALMWLGRGDFTVEEWTDIVDQARQEWTPRTADYLIAHPLLADYLLEGLNLHGHPYVEHPL